MSPGTALLSILSGAALIRVRPEDGDRAGVRRDRVVTMLGAAVVLIAGYRIGEYLRGAQTGLDHLWVAPVTAGTISPLTASAFALIGHQILVVTIVLMSGAGIYRFVFGGAPLSVLAAMSLPTSVVVLTLGIGLAATRSDVGLARTLCSERLDGWLARRMLPAAVLVPTVAGLLCLRGWHVGWFGTPAAMSLLTLTNVVVLGAVVWTTAATLGAMDTRRRQAEQEVRAEQERYRRLNADLEVRVHERTAELRLPGQRGEDAGTDPNGKDDGKVGDTRSAALRSA